MPRHATSPCCEGRPAGGCPPSLRGPASRAAARHGALLLWLRQGRRRTGGQWWPGHGALGAWLLLRLQLLLVQVLRQPLAEVLSQR